MRSYLKKFPLVRKAAYWGRSFFRSLKDNPDILEKFERALFERRYKNPVLTPPTPHEENLIRNLRTRMKKLPMEIPGPTMPASQKLWMKYKNELRTKILTDDPRQFLRWDVVAHTMGASLGRLNYKKLNGFPFWKEWSKALATLPPINQLPHFKFPHTDGTTLVHAYHLAQLKATTGIDVSQNDLIIDFGGGYGAMCAVAHALGFKGEYIIFDLPEFLLLQQFYLELRGISTVHIKFIDTLPELKERVRRRRGLLIATWSISEVPEKFRNEFFAAVNPEAYLIGYQASVGEVNNNVYFKKFSDTRRSIEWNDFPALNFSNAGNRYLIGSGPH